MNAEILIIQKKLNLIMKMIAKIVSTKYKINPVLLQYDSINYSTDMIVPKILIIDQTVFEFNAEEIIRKYGEYFHGSEIIIITIEEDPNIKTLLKSWGEIEVINLWRGDKLMLESLLEIIEKSIYKLSCITH